LFAFGLFIISSSYSKMNSLSQLNSKIILSNYASDVIHSLQSERGLSSGYLSNRTNDFKNALLKQRKQSDIEIKEFKEYMYLKFGSLNLDKENELIALRKVIDNNTIDSDDIIKKYSVFIDHLLNIISNVAKSSHVPEVTQNILAYTNFLYLKENTGLERASVVVLLSNADTHTNNYLKFLNLNSLKKQNEQFFFNYASEKIIKYYKAATNQKVFYKLSQLEHEIENNTISDNISAKEWYDIMTLKLNRLDKVGKFIKDDTKKKIELELSNAKIVLTITIALVLLSLWLFFALLLAFLRLADEEQRLRGVMDKYIISSVTDLKGVITDVSQAFCNLSGYTKSELIGKHHNIVRHPEMPKKVYRDLWAKISQGDSWSGKIKNLVKDGGFYWVYANIEPLYDKNGKIDSYISIRLDITENELLLLEIQNKEDKNIKQEKMMQQQHRLAQMGEMLSMIAHQWRQPLSAITAAAGVLEIKAKLNKLEKETTLELSSKIKDFSSHLSLTIDDFRNFFKANKTKSSTDFQKIVQSVLSIIEHSLESNKITLTQNITEVEEFVTYENELKQVLLNLIKNAEDILLEKEIQNANIKIEVNKRELSVSDNGGGVPKDLLEKIFDPYFSTKIQKDGTGLGLYMSKMIVEDHCKGKLRVENTHEGAKFTITLGEENG